MRSPDAVERCAWPIHIPSPRSGMMTMPSKRLKMKKEPMNAGLRATIRAPNSRTAACARSGRKESSGTYIARCRFARMVCANSASLRPANFASSAGSCANALTTWTPTMFSSTTVATSASFCCTSRSVGCAMRL